ncbi:M15 family metallopeptidase [Corticicoccus populi]|uniref:D-alanyl-D-alanine carboxypeptidase family protein n=1 Tax=Corticicoccus populi TaxID=1812821 RepID=A0ABW5WX99_9STAP
MKYVTYLKYLGVASAVLYLSACGGNEEEQTESENDVQEESSGEENQNSGDAESTDDAEASEEAPLVTEEDIYNEESILALANKSNFLGEEYVPADMIPVNVPVVFDNPETNQLREPAANALMDLFAEAESEGYTLYARSGYRSYNTQVGLYNNYVANHGQEEADRFSAQPGSSEHQTGLAMDVTSESVNLELSEAFGETDEGTWVRENAHRFGFIIRYPDGYEDITGYMYEPWHLRYLGEEVASDVYESGLTYEEYIKESGIEINEE